MKILIAVFTILLACLQAHPADSSSAAKPVRLAAAGKARFSGTVEIYVTDWCGYCKKAIEYMKSHDIRYVAYNIEEDSAAAKRHKELGGRGVPLIVIGSTRISGFSPERLEYYLENNK